MAGRKSKYTPETADKIIQAIEVGGTYRTAAWYAGISEDTLSRWMAKYADFADRVNEARGKRAVRWLAVLEKASALDWRAALEKLRVCEREEYGKELVSSSGTVKHTHEVSGTVSTQRVTGFEDLSDEALDALEELVAQRTAASVAEV